MFNFELSLITEFHVGMNRPLFLMLVILMFLQIACKDEPTYDPFDDVFDVSIRKLIKEGCDTLPAGCNYYNLIEKSVTSRMYYQVYGEDFSDVVAKGYVYHIDTFRIKNKKDFYRNDDLQDSLLQVPFDISLFNKAISKYKYSYLDREKEVLRILNNEIQDTVILRFNLAETYHPEYVVRNLEYFITNPMAGNK